MSSEQRKLWEELGWRKGELRSERRTASFQVIAPLRRGTGRMAEYRRRLQQLEEKSFAQRLQELER